MASSYQTLKSALAARVRTDQAERLASQRQDQGEGLLCPAGAGNINFDIYGRPATQNTLNVGGNREGGGAAECGHYVYSAARLMQFENNQRPFLPVAAAGLRGAGDLAGLGRDLIPQDLYGNGFRGNFVRHYPTPNNSPWQVAPMASASVPHRPVQNFDFSHDATTRNQWPR